MVKKKKKTTCRRCTCCSSSTYSRVGDGIRWHKGSMNPNDIITIILLLSYRRRRRRTRYRCEDRVYDARYGIIYVKSIFRALAAAGGGASSSRRRCALGSHSPPDALYTLVIPFRDFRSTSPSRKHAASCYQHLSLS